jgi:hypothetical protein
VRAALLAVVLAAGTPASAQETPPGYPPKMGDVSGQLGDQAVAWETFDFSIGAFDASAWVERYDGPYRFRIIGYAPGNPESDADRLRVAGEFADRPATGALRAVEVAIVAGSDLDGKRLSSEGQSATVMVDRIRLPESGTGYGMASGRITATLCPAGGAAPQPCRPFEAEFTTQVQFSK